MELSLSGNKKKLKKSEVLYEFTLDLFKPTNKKYPEFDYEELVRESEAAAPGPGPNVDGGQLTDRDKAVVRSLEARYGAKERVNKNKRKRFNFESSYFDKGKGYEQDDSFIDDSEAYDELVPSSMDTLQGGFYVNKGRLEFRNVDEEAWSSEDDDALSKKKETQKSVVEKAKLKQGGDSKVSVGEVEQPDTSKVPRARMAGAPPTKIKATSVARVAKNLMKAKARKEVQSESSSTVTINAPASPLKSLSEAGGEPSLQAAAVDNSIHAEREPQNEPSNNLDPNTRATDNIPVDDIHFSHKLFPEISADVQKLIDEFKKTTEYLAAPGMKKRLQRIDDQMASDGVRSHERSRVLASISDYVGIQKQSLYLRTKAVRDESKSVTEAESGATTAGTHGTTSKLSTPKTNSLPIPSDSVSSVSSSKSVPHVSTSNNGSVAESPITEVELVKKTPTYQALLKVMPNLKAKHGSDIEIVLSRCILAGKLTPDNMNETAIKLLTGDASTQNAYASFLRKSVDATFAANLSQQMEKLMQASKQHNTQHVTTTKNPKDSPVMRPGLNTATKRPAVVVPSCSSVAPPVKSKPITSAAMSSAKPMASSTQASSTAAVAAVPRPIASPATRTVTPPATQSVSATPAAIAQLGSAFTAKDYPKIQKMFSEYQKAFVEAGKEAVAKSELAKAAQLQNLASLGVDPKLVNLEKNIVWDDALSTAFRNFMSVLVAAWKMLQLDGGVNAKSLEEIAIPTFKSVCSMIDPAFTLRMLVDKAVALCADLRSLLDHPDVKGPTKRRRPPMKPSMSGNLGATTISKPPAKKTAKDADVEVVKLR